MINPSSNVAQPFYQSTEKIVNEGSKALAIFIAPPSFTIIMSQ
jgi:hypothetical protein